MYVRHGPPFDERSRERGASSRDIPAHARTRRFAHSVAYDRSGHDSRGALCLKPGSSTTAGRFATVVQGLGCQETSPYRGHEGDGLLALGDRHQSCVPLGPADDRRTRESHRLALGDAAKSVGPIRLMQLPKTDRLGAAPASREHRQATLLITRTPRRYSLATRRGVCGQLRDFAAARGGPARTVGAYSSSCSRPSKTRLLTMSRETSGYPS